MKWLKKYDVYKEDKLYDYILEDTLNESVGDTLKRLKEIAKKGLLTATLFASLSANASFKEQYDKLDQSEKNQIENSIKTEDDKLKIEIGNNFKSGKYKLSQEDITSINDKLESIKNFTEKNKGKSFIINITSSESQVPNRDADTGGSLKIGELAKFRAEETVKVIDKFIKEKNLQDLFKIKYKTLVGSEKWTKEDKALDYKYTRDQYVKIEVSVNSCPVCGMIDVSEEGAVGNYSTNYITYNKTFNKKDIDQKSGNFKLDTGTIPDRLQIYIDDKLVGDTGYIATKKDTVYVDYKYIPEYILGLTKAYKEGTDATKSNNLYKMNIKKVNRFEDLEKLILKNDIKIDYKNIGKEDKKETLQAMFKLKKMFDSGVREFVFYELEGDNNISYTLNDDSKALNVKVYSPVGKTHYTINGKCDK